jgi:histidinol-phosphate/aromatic aminotransferase/cobyric acid decarboxylase-like protein
MSHARRCATSTGPPTAVGRCTSTTPWLGEALSTIPGVEPHLNKNVHFQYAFSPRSRDIAAGLQRHGIGVRVLSAAHGVTPDAMRIVAPRSDERDRFAAAVAAVASR